MKLDAMFALANFAVKGCQRTDGCSGSQHTQCIQKKIMEYFSKNKATSVSDYSALLPKSRFVSFIFLIDSSMIRHLSFGLVSSHLNIYLTWCFVLVTAAHSYRPI
jgi:hypothetical protein